VSPGNGVVNSGMIPSLLQLMKDENKNGYSAPLLWARVAYLYPVRKAPLALLDIKYLTG